MRLNACKVRMVLPDGTLRTSYVYGPTAKEYAEVMASNDGVTYKIIGVEDAHGYKEEADRRRKHWWEREAPPDRYFFNKHLSREPISSGAGPHVVGAPDDRGSSESFGESQVAGNGSGDHDGDAT